MLQNIHIYACTYSLLCIHTKRDSLPLDFENKIRIVHEWHERGVSGNVNTHQGDYRLIRAIETSTHWVYALVLDLSSRRISDNNNWLRIHDVPLSRLRFRSYKTLSIKQVYSAAEVVEPILMRFGQRVHTSSTQWQRFETQNSKTNSTSYKQTPQHTGEKNYVYRLILYKLYNSLFVFIRYSILHQVYNLVFFRFICQWWYFIRNTRTDRI